MGQWVRQRSLGILFVSLFLASWIVQLFFEWRLRQASSASTGAELLVGGLLGRVRAVDVRELAIRVPAARGVHDRDGLPVYAGSSESPDSEERIEAKLDALLEQSGVDPKDVERLAPKHQKRT